LKKEGKTMAIITISRKIGSLGDEIAKAVADKLGYGYIEKSTISKVLSDQGFSAPEVEKYDEKKPSIWQSLSIQKKRFAHLIRAAVYELAANENVMIVGRGGQAILKDFPGTLHVRIIAPDATRLSRLMEQKKCDGKDAQRIIRQSDRDSSGYINAYFDADWNDQDLYDLVINTRTMAVDTAVAMIKCALDADEFKKSFQPPEKFRDHALTQKAQAVLLEIPGLGATILDVEQGVATLSGLAGSLTAKEECEKAVSNINGISKVNNQLKVVSSEQ
jgi:cytidylate kinase